MVLVTTAEIKSMNESELLRGMEVNINAEDLPELEEGRFYVADLIGLPVYDEQGSKSAPLGRTEHRQQVVYVIAVPGQKKDYLLPEKNVKRKSIWQKSALSWSCLSGGLARMKFFICNLISRTD